LVSFNRTNSRQLFDGWSLARSADDVLRALDAGGEECSAEVKSTVLGTIEAGRISGTQDAPGRHDAPAELHRVYPAPAKSAGAPPVGARPRRPPFSIFGIA
jgi:hypothetical protein